MKKILLAAFLILDVALMAGSAFVLYGYVLRHMPAKGTAAVLNHPGAVSTVPAPAVSTSAAQTVGNPLAVPAAPANSPLRKILFSYRNPRARQVSIRADFTGWKAEAMQKGANNVWTYQAQLSPGEYAYCYTADDKTFKDPANKRTKQIGRTMVSAIVVEPLAPKPPK